MSKYSDKVDKKNRDARKHPDEYANLPDRKDVVEEASKVTEPVAQETKPVMRVVYARLPKALTALCAKKTGKTADECYQILRPLSENEGIPGVERQVYEVWGITREEWAEIRPLYDNPEPANKDIAPNGARITHLEKPKKEEPPISINEDDIAAALAETGHDVAALDMSIEVDKEREYIKEQKELLEQAQWDYDHSLNRLITKEREIWAKARESERVIKAIAACRGEEAKTAETRRILDALTHQKLPELHAELEAALLRVKQAQSEIEMTEDVISTQMAKEA